jgi:hypothetical protein
MARLIVDNRDDLARLDCTTMIDGQEVRLRDTGEIVVWSESTGDWLFKSAQVHPLYRGDTDDWETVVNSYRHCMEVAVALLRQGQDTRAMQVLSDALHGVFHPAPPPADDAPLELAIEDETPEIPEFSIISQAGELRITDEGWFFSEEFIKELKEAPWADNSDTFDGAALVLMEEKVRWTLTESVKTGRIRKL